MRLILVPPTFHVASLKRYTPKFSGPPKKLTWCQPFGVQGLSKSGNPDLCPPKKAIWRCFFAQNRFSWPNGQFLASISDLPLFYPNIVKFPKNFLSLKKSFLEFQFQWRGCVSLAACLHQRVTSIGQELLLHQGHPNSQDQLWEEQKDIFYFNYLWNIKTNLRSRGKKLRQKMSNFWHLLIPIKSAKIDRITILKMHNLLKISLCFLKNCRKLH